MGVTSVALAVLALAACGGAPAEPTATTQPTEAAAATEQPAEATAPAATARPEATDAVVNGGATAAPDDEVLTGIVEAARTALGEYLGVEGTDLALISAEEREWSSSALGCPAPDQMYMQVITPGYQLTFNDDATQSHEVHTTTEGEPIILCEDGQPTQLPRP
jgi:hypothetical protein